MKRQLSEQEVGGEDPPVQLQNDNESENGMNGVKLPKFKIPSLDYNHFDDYFNNLGEIGSGGFGKVFKVRHKVSYKLFAIKRIDLGTPLDSALKKAVTREVKTLKKTSGDYVVIYEDSWLYKDKDQNKDYLYIQMELCSDNLKNIIKEKPNCFGRKSSEDMSPLEYYISCNLFKELLECVRYLHESIPTIIHRDLKPENVLIVEDPNGGRFLKLCDFGLAKPSQLKTQTHTRGQGSIGYMAQELTSSTKYSFKVDIYSLGRIALKLFDYTINNTKIPNKYIKLKPKWRALKSIIKDMNSSISNERPTSAEIIDNFEMWGIPNNDLQKFGISGDLDILSNYSNKFFEDYFREKNKSKEGTPKKHITDYFQGPKPISQSDKEIRIFLKDIPDGNWKSKLIHHIKGFELICVTI